MWLPVLRSGKGPKVFPMSDRSAISGCKTVFASLEENREIGSLRMRFRDDVEMALGEVLGDMTLLRRWSLTPYYYVLSEFPNFYTPVFRRDVLWYGAVRPSVRPSVRLLARKNIDANGGFFSIFVHRCA